MNIKMNTNPSTMIYVSTYIGIFHSLSQVDAPQNSFKDSNASSKLKIMKVGVGLRSLVHNTSRVRRVC